MKRKCKIDLPELREEIRVMTRYDELYRVLQEELSNVDHWKAKGRGNPVKAHSMIGKKGHEKDLQISPNG